MNEKFRRREFLKTAGLTAAAFSFSGCLHINRYKATKPAERPNVLLCISEDQCWAHTSIAGCKGLHTPAFDRIAREGILFTNAYCSAPSCSPSRSAVLTGQEIWRLEDAGNLFGTLYGTFPAYTAETADVWQSHKDKCVRYRAMTELMVRAL